MILIRRHGADGAVIHAEGHSGSVTEYHDFRLRSQTKGVAPSFNVNHRLFVPIGLIEVESILAYFTVAGDQALVIDSRTVTFCTIGGTEIKHVPDERSPNKRSFIDYFPVFYVIESLPVVRMPV